MKLASSLQVRYWKTTHDIAMARTRSKANRKVVSSHDPTKLGFLDLPPEIRLQIYRLIFTNSTTYIATGYSRTDPQPVNMLLNPFPLQLFCTCSTIYDEAHPVLYSTNSFLLHRASNFRMLMATAGDDIGLITELCFQSGFNFEASCNLTKSRIKKLQRFTGLTTITIIGKRRLIYRSNTKRDMERLAAVDVNDGCMNVVDCVKAMPHLSYKYRSLQHGRSKEVE